MQIWWQEILAFIRTVMTNAGSEGTYRAIKTVGRDAYGFRNPVNQRSRTRCGTTRRACGHLAPANFAAFHGPSPAASRIRTPSR